MVAAALGLIAANSPAAPRYFAALKLGVLGGSFASGLVGYLVLRFASRPEPLARHNA